MPIICFEGASSIGKTTLSKYLRDNYNTCVIPEVNLLFARKENEEKFWYFERQVERWEMAVSAAKNYKTVILDGDAFQPFWYNWAYDFDGLESLESITGFYREKLAAREIDFPDKYFVLTLNKNELQKRKANDALRTRKNFERHLRFIEPQRVFYSFIKSINNDLVEFIENIEMEVTGEKILNSIGGYSSKYSSLELFDAAQNWLKNNNAEKFISSL